MVGVEVPVDVVIIGCATACFTECAGVRTPTGIHELYQWYMLNWSITKVRKFTNVALPQPTYKKPNDIETRGQSQNFNRDVSERFQLPAASAKKKYNTL